MSARSLNRPDVRATRPQPTSPLTPRRYVMTFAFGGGCLVRKGATSNAAWLFDRQFGHNALLELIDRSACRDDQLLHIRGQACDLDAGRLILFGWLKGGSPPLPRLAHQLDPRIKCLDI